jgi:hypothetical protein
MGFFEAALFFATGAFFATATGFFEAALFFATGFFAAVFFAAVFFVLIQRSSGQPSYQFAGSWVHPSTAPAPSRSISLRFCRLAGGRITRVSQ